MLVESGKWKVETGLSLSTVNFPLLCLRSKRQDAER
jgi:hypothetical protein